jgi:hypothetical protein
VTPDWLELHKFRKSGNTALIPPLRLPNGVVLRHGYFDNPAGLVEEIYVHRWHETGAVPGPDSIMVDIGANIGAVLLYWASLSPSLSIHAYEPNPWALDTLRQNLVQNSLENRVQVFPEAVGRGVGDLDLWVDVPTALSTGYLSMIHPLKVGDASPSRWSGWRRSGAVWTSVRSGC